MTSSKYVLVSAARNEEGYIEGTLDSVVSQTCLPEKWIIVSDGSTDKTEAIVLKYCRNHPFIDLIKRSTKDGRNFGSKAAAIAAGYARISVLHFSYVGILDVDVTFEPGYYEAVMERLDSDGELGIAGGLLWDSCGGTFVQQKLSIHWSVSGPVQMFRRGCFDEIGGYWALREGGIDAAAEVMARMKGWRVRTFPELKVLHHRRTGTEGKRVLRSCVQRGVQDYMLGYHPLFSLMRYVAHFGERPAVLSAVATIWGYFSSLASRKQRVLPCDFVRFLRKEQLGRILGGLGLGTSRQWGAPKA